MQGKDIIWQSNPASKISLNILKIVIVFVVFFIYVYYRLIDSLAPVENLILVIVLFSSIPFLIFLSFFTFGYIMELMIKSTPCVMKVRKNSIEIWDKYGNNLSKTINLSEVEEFFINILQAENYVRIKRKNDQETYTVLGSIYSSKGDCLDAALKQVGYEHFKKEGLNYYRKLKTKS